MVKRAYRLFKRLIINILIIAVIAYAGLYLLLSTPAVQQKVRNIAVRELSHRLNVPVGIGSINIQPFNKLTINDLFLPDQAGDTLLYVNRIMAGFEWLPLRHKQLVITNAQLFGFDVHIRKDTPAARPNFQFVIDAFRSADTVKKELNIDLQIRSLLIRRGHLKYDLLSAPELNEKNRFDKNHVEIRNFLSTLSVKAFRKDSANIYLKRMSFEEKSGFSVRKLSFRAIANREKGTLQHFSIRLPESELAIDSALIDYARVTEKSQFADSSLIRLSAENSQITLSDLAPFAPALRHFHTPVRFSCDIKGELNHLTATRLTLHYADELRFSGRGNLDGLSDPRQLYLFGKVNELYVSPAGVRTLLTGFSDSERPLPAAAGQLGDIRFRGEISGFLSDLVAYGRLTTDLGEIQADIMLSKSPDTRLFSYNGTLSTENFDLGGLFPENSPFGQIGFKLAVNGRNPAHEKPSGKLVGEIGPFDFKGHTYQHIGLNVDYGPAGYEGMLNIDDPYGRLTMEGTVNLLQEIPKFRFTAQARNIRLHELQLIRNHPQSRLSFDINANFSGDTPDRANGTLTLDSLLFRTPEEQFFLKQLSVVADNQGNPQSIQIRSGMLDGEIRGRYTFKSLPRSFNRLLSPVIPSLIVPAASADTALNDFSYSFTLQNTEAISRLTGFPLTLHEETIIKGFYSDRHNQFRMEASLPQFRLKKFRFEDGSVWIDKRDGQAALTLHVNNRNKKDKLILLALNAIARNDQIDMKLNWSNTAQTTFSGAIAATSRFKRNAGRYPLTTRIDLQPTTMIINDTVWNIHPAEITVDSGRIAVRDFEVRHEKQYLQLSGIASSDPEDEMSLQLQDINLDYIFQTLNVNHVNFGGNATGDISITNLLKAPLLSSRTFDVTNFAYNDAVLGDLHLFCRFDAVTKGIFMEGNIAQEGFPDTEIRGEIYPGRDSLGLHFDAYNLNLAFLRPFVGKVMQDMSGRATGKINFYGKFSALTVTGDAYLKDVTFGIDYLNTTYHLSDSLHLRPDRIYFDEVVLRDKDNHTAQVRGLITHRHFKDLTYEIGLSNAKNLLVYQVTEQLNPAYFGTVYGSGAAQITGDMTRTSIDVNLRTGPHSRFTYLLDRTETAGDYQFITFVDGMHRKKLTEDVPENTESPKNVRPSPEALPESPHMLNLNLQIDATPDATFELIMDPATGDVIKANGSGSIRIEYSTLSTMKMYGTYTLDKGSYSFNLQDLIIKDFSITPGSSITFRGSPLEADLDIQGSYTVTADLKDLDESFADQKELQRTSVPVQTTISITGDLQRPDLTFNIELPTLTQDIERRVKSIISTDDMMNRQIIYLLALGKFYTPDYMNTGQRSNELVSVASSTLSSQLNNMLGQISDNWNIGTNIRSDKGDFSDVEFELALSSQLLNNRLILNGNFGYRDNTMSDNSFIGDFDLEYLLSASGNLRLKAYNHYNDRNYYIKSALTTQGVGIIFKRDFDRFSDLFYRIKRNLNKRKEKSNKNNVPVLSLPKEPELLPEKPHPEAE